jgi:catechol-2,3-dioxygenase
MRIHKLIIESSNLPRQEAFYRDVMGFHILLSEPEVLEIQIGSSVLKIIPSGGTRQYHYAMNIDPQLIESARLWLKSRLNILPDLEESPPKEIIPFPHWNAHSVYFYDADQNILEFIARHDLPATDKDAFEPRGVINISEVGLATTNVREMAEQLKTEFGLEPYSGDLNRFAAIGDVEGMFILVDPSKKTWFPTGEDVLYSPFTLTAENADRVFVKSF